MEGWCRTARGTCMAPRATVAAISLAQCLRSALPARRQFSTVFQALTDGFRNQAWSWTHTEICSALRNTAVRVAAEWCLGSSPDLGLPVCDPPKMKEICKMRNYLATSDSKPRPHQRGTTSIWCAALVFSLWLGLPAVAQTFTLVHQFKSGPGGINPESGVIFDNAGNLYGTTLNDGAFDVGTVYQITAGGKEREFSFTGVNGEGDFPQYGSLIHDSAGNFYGTTSEGGTYNNVCAIGCGTVFIISPSGKETVLYEFTGVNGDGQQPLSGLARDSAGNLYGSTSLRGGTNGLGMVYKISSKGEETILHSFDGSDGGFPYAGLTFDSKGNLYGTTTLNTVFEITTSGV